MQTKYSIEELLPHREPLILLDKLVEYGEDFTECYVKITQNSLFLDSNNKVSSCIGIEYMAQTVATYSGMSAINNNDSVKLGFLIGTRGYNVKTSFFTLGQELIVKAKVDFIESGIGDFDCLIEDKNTKEILVSAKLKAFQPENIEDYL